MRFYRLIEDDWYKQRTETVPYCLYGFVEATVGKLSKTFTSQPSHVQMICI